mmetsp:Transcript_13451/g.32093  ORF Transcript_13451/g.32093 Transcript_13451/m.32093 type:complete len:89 (-) Transcript_13451:449-715(-)
MSLDVVASPDFGEVTEWSMRSVKDSTSAVKTCAFSCTIYNSSQLSAAAGYEVKQLVFKVMVYSCVNVETTMELSRIAAADVPDIQVQL